MDFYMCERDSHSHKLKNRNKSFAISKKKQRTKQEKAEKKPPRRDKREARANVMLNDTINTTDLFIYFYSILAFAINSINNPAEKRLKKT